MIGMAAMPSKERARPYSAERDTMEILKQYPEIMDAKEKYDLLRSPKMDKISNAKGQVLEVASYVLRTDLDKEGNVVEVLSIKTTDGDLYATNSSTFIREFEAILECTEPVFGIDVIDGVSKSNRHYTTCAWH